jgi:ATP-binding cassette subfamily B protein
VGNIITVTLILGAMAVLSWQITLAALVLLPLFILPTRFWGRKLQAITRESYDLNAAMNSLMVERFNVAGAQLAKLFGRRQDESKTFEAQAARVSDIGVKRAIYGRIFFTALMLMAYFATALAYGWGGFSQHGAKTWQQRLPLFWLNLRNWWLRSIATKVPLRGSNQRG